jgi:hypothetical protein
MLYVIVFRFRMPQVRLNPTLVFSESLELGYHMSP